MTILALDPATSTGWAAGPPDADPHFGSVRLGDGSIGERMDLMARFVETMIRDFDIQEVYFEQPLHHVPRMGNAKTLRLACALAGTVEMAAHWHRIPAFEVPMMMWRKHFIGVARRPKGTHALSCKEQAIEKCAELGWKPRDYDEAEAIGIWDYARSLKK